MTRAGWNRLRTASLLLAAVVAAGAAVPRRGDVARVYFPEVPGDPNPEALPSSSDIFLSSEVFPCLVRADAGGEVVPGLARTWTVTEKESPPEVVPDVPVDQGAAPPIEARGLRWVFQLDPLARFPDGRRVMAADVVASWEALLTSTRSPYRWLLDPVAGARAFRRGRAARVEGLVAAGVALEIRLSRPAPDLLLRLAHPALGIRAFRGGEPTAMGAGPFNAEGTGTQLGINVYHAAGRPHLDGLEPVEPLAVDPALLLESGQVDLAVLYGRSAGEILSAQASHVRMQRLPGWDRVYSLMWNSPAGNGQGNGAGIPLRLRDALERRAMIRYLFDGRGESAGSLLPGPQDRRRLAAGPGGTLGGTVSLLHDGDDPLAASLASRIKATWEELGLRVDTEALAPEVLWYRLAAGEYLAAVLLHHPPTADPVLGLAGTFSRLGGSAAPVLEALDRASRHMEPEARLLGARRAEKMLIEPGALTPLVRVHAWLATAPSLAGVEGGPAGILALENAWRLAGEALP